MSSLKEFINNFKHTNPDWSQAPDGFPKCDLAGLTSAEIGNFNAIKGLWALSRPPKPKQRSREWTDPEGYKWLVQWSNAVLLRFIIRILTDSLPKSEYRRKSQLDDAARSVVRNLEEGYKRATTKEYIDFIGYSQGSLEEVKGDIRELAEDGFLAAKQGSSLQDLGIELGDLNKALKGNKGDYRSLKDSRGELKEDKGEYRKLEESKGALEDAPVKSLRPVQQQVVYGASDHGAGKGRLKEAKGEHSKTPWDYHSITFLYPPLNNLRV